VQRWTKMKRGGHFARLKDEQDENQESKEHHHGET
jgi:hypothetical protein